MGKMHRLLFLACLLILSIGCAGKKDDNSTLTADAAKVNARLAAAREAVGRVASSAAEVMADPARFSTPLYPERKFAAYEGVMVYAKEPDGKSTILGTGAVPVVGKAMGRLRSLEHLEPELQREVKQNADISMAWFGTGESLAVFYPPFDMVALVPPGMDITKDILPYRRAAEGNPSGGPVWTEPYIDITGKGYMFTVSRPVLSASKPESVIGVAGIDVALEPLVRDDIGPSFTDRMLVSSESYVLAVGERLGKALGVESLGRIYYLRQVEKDVPAPEKFRLDRHADMRVVSLGRSLQTLVGGVSLPWGDKVLHLKAEKIPETGWYLVEGSAK